RERLIGGNVQIREEDKPFAEPRILAHRRLLDLQQQLGLTPGVVDRDDARTRTHVVRVRECASLTCGRLDEHLVPALYELARTGRCERDAVLVRLDLPGDSDPQDARDSSC